MKRKIFYLVIFSLVALATIFQTQLLAAPYYEGKKIRIVCGTSGGYTRIANLLAKYLPRYIPGNPTIVVEEMSGANGIVAANYMYNIAKPDGLTICTSNRGLPFGQLLKAPGIKFDLRKFAWIGSPTVESNVITIRSDLPYKSVADLKNAKTPIKLGATGPHSSSTHFPLLLNQFVGTNFKMVFYRRSPEIAVAIERGEVDGKATSYGSFRKQIEEGFYRPLIRSRISEPEIADLPVDEDLTSDPLGKKLMALRTGPDRIGRPYFAAPNTPPELMDILTHAFAEMAKNDEVAMMFKRIGMRLNYTTADESVEILNNLFSQPDDIVQAFSKYIKF